MPPNRETEAKLKLIVEGQEEFVGSIDDVQKRLGELEKSQDGDSDAKKRNEDATKKSAEAQKGLLGILSKISPELASVASQGIGAIESLGQLGTEGEDGKKSLGGLDDIVKKFGGNLKLLGAASIAAAAIAILVSTIKRLNEELRKVNAEIQKIQDRETGRVESERATEADIRTSRRRAAALFGPRDTEAEAQAVAEQAIRLKKKSPNLPFIEAASQIPVGLTDTEAEEFAILKEAGAIGDLSGVTNQAKRAVFENAKRQHPELIKSVKGRQGRRAVTKRSTSRARASRDSSGARADTARFLETQRGLTPDEAAELAGAVQNLPLIEEEGGVDLGFSPLERIGRLFGGISDLVVAAFSSDTFEQRQFSRAAARATGSDFTDVLTEAQIETIREARRQLDASKRPISVNITNTVNNPNQRNTTPSNGRDPRRNGERNTRTIDGGI